MGGSVFTIFAAIYYWFPKITGRMLSESLGKLSFYLMFFGFLMTFLIQHVIGLDGMPRRVYEYDNVGHLALYNLISTIGSFILAAGVIATIVNVHRSLKVGVAAGPDPWKANTLEWFTSSPPPVNNFDVLPLVRSTEPMKDIRREIERRSVDSAAAGSRDGARGRQAGGRVVGLTPATGLAPRIDAGDVGIAPRTRQLLGDYLELTKPKVQSLLLLTTIATMYVAGDPSARLVALTCLGGYLSAGGAGAVNHWFDRDIDAQMARTATRPIPAGRISPRAALTFGCVLAGAVAARALARGQPARRRAVVLRLPRLRLRLHDLAEAAHAAEHRHRRRRRRGAAARRLGGRHRLGQRHSR